MLQRTCKEISMNLLNHTEYFGLIMLNQFLIMLNTLAEYFGWILCRCDSHSNVFFIERIFVFFMTLFLEKIGTLSARKRHCHSGLLKPILKILQIYRKNILEKQLSWVIGSKNVFRLLHAPRFQMVSRKLNMMIKVVRYLSKSEATVDSCSMRRLR